VAATLSITTTSLPGGTVGIAYSQTVGSSGGTAPLTWSVASGSLPAGLNLNTSTGVITGTPSSAGTASFTLHLADSASQTADRSLSITIAAAPSITTSSLSGGTAGTAYSQILAASGGTAPLAWSVSAGTLPGGLSLNSGT